ncbi:hypothetical protein B0H11DRAFT_1921840 [Mycena galericulata]|nr:hypothetical protein B0H11DRAFT_1921840 [Mycena galericulata]
MNPKPRTTIPSEQHAKAPRSRAYTHATAGGRPQAHAQCREQPSSGLRVSAPPPNGTNSEKEDKKMGFMPATSTTLYIAHALLAPANETGPLVHLLKVYDFHILVAPNPDGYVHTWQNDRFWYKNRQVVGPNAACVGIDMNRWVDPSSFEFE